MKDTKKYELLTNLKNNIYKTGINESNFEILNKFSFDNEDYIRAYVAEILVNFSNKEGEDILLRLACDDSSFVRTEACDSLCISESPNTYNFLKIIAKKDINGIVRGYAICSLGDIGIKLKKHDDLIPFLENILVKEKVVFTKINIYTVLYKLGKTEYFNNLLTLIDTKRYQNRCSVINCLYEISNEDNKEQILNALNERKKKEKSIAVISTIDDVYKEIF